MPKWGASCSKNVESKNKNYLQTPPITHHYAVADNDRASDHKNFNPRRERWEKPGQWAGWGKTFCPEGYEICFLGEVSHAIDLFSVMHGTTVWESLFASITTQTHRMVIMENALSWIPVSKFNFNLDKPEIRAKTRLFGQNCKSTVMWLGLERWVRG